MVDNYIDPLDRDYQRMLVRMAYLRSIDAYYEFAARRAQYHRDRNIKPVLNIQPREVKCARVIDNTTY